MSEQKAAQVLAAIRKSEPQKKRVTFFVSIESKAALAAWCKQNGVSESAAIDELIRATVPPRFFKGRK
jgi:hypothetical protein